MSTIMFTESYEKVRQKLSDAQYHSDLHTEDSEDDDTTVRHSKRRRRCVHGAPTKI